MLNDAFVDNNRTLLAVVREAFVHDTLPREAVLHVTFSNDAFTELMFDTHAFTNEALLPLMTAFTCEAVDQ